MLRIAIHYMGLSSSTLWYPPWILHFGQAMICYWWHGRPLIIFIDTFGVPLKLSMLAVKNLCSSHPAEYEKCRCVMRSWMIEIGIVIMRKLVVRPLTIIAFWRSIGEGKRSQMWMEDCSMTREWITNKLTLSWHGFAGCVNRTPLRTLHFRSSVL